MTIALLGIPAAGSVSAQSLEERKAAVQELRLKDYEPRSVFRIPRTDVRRAKFPVVDMHSHDYAADDAGVAAWVRTLDSCNIRYSSVMHCEWIGAPFEEYIHKYRPYGDRFLFWCCFDYTGFGEPGWAERAVRELERCHALGARGVGEMVDKGLGDTYARPVPGRASTSTIRVCARLSNGAASWECPLASISPSRSGCTSRWTGIMTD